MGREAELSELDRLLSDPEVHLLTVLGAGGMGKTRLALQAAEMQAEQVPRDRFANGVYFASLAPLQSTGAIVPTVAKALSFSFYAGGEPRQQLLDYLRQKAMLLVLDNFEHLLDGVGLVSDILRVSRDVKILATSRARLNVQEEHLFHIGGMDFPDWETPQDALEYSAVKLFLQSARRVRPGFELQADSIKYVARVCRLAQGMPLGILLAAAWVEMLTPEEIAAEITQSLDFLQTDLRNVPARQRSMRAVFDHSWNLMTEQEKESFARLSVFRGGFTRQAAQEVTDISLRGLMSLVNKSLLEHTPSGRCGIHELLRQYAAEKLEGSPQGPELAEGARDRHAAYYTAALEEWAGDLKGPRQRAALAAVEADLDNARGAWEWAAKRGHVAQLDRAADGLGLFYDWRMRLEEGEAVFGLAADALSGAASGDDLRALAKVLGWRACFTLDHERVSRMVRQCLALMERPELAQGDTRRERALALKQAGKQTGRGVFPGRRYAQEIIGHLERSLALYGEVGDRWEASDVLYLLGWANWLLSAYDQAAQFGEEGLAIARALGDRRGTARHLMAVGTFTHFGGQSARGERLLREAIDAFEEIGDRFGVARGLDQLGCLLIQLGRFSEARPTEEESVQILDDLGRRHDANVGSELWLGAAVMHLGLYGEARKHIHNYLARCYRVDFKLGLGYAHEFLGEIAIATGAYGQVEGLLQESLALFRELGSERSVEEVLCALACNAHWMGCPTQARRYLIQVPRITSRAVRQNQPPLFPLVAMALLTLDEGDVERAVELHALAARYPHVANSRWFEDVAGRHIAAVAATLPPEVVAAAQERGRARDLDATVEELLAELEE